MATLNDFITKLRSKSATRIFKIERLDSNENVIADLGAKVLSGDVSFNDGSGSRVNSNIMFSNNDGDFIPDPTGNIWMNKKFKISTGLMIDTEEYYISRGIFTCSEPEIISNHDAENVVNIQFLDKFSLLDGTLGGTLENTYIIPVGTSIFNAVTSILSDAGDVKLPIIEPTSEVTPYTLTINAGSNYGEVLISLAKMLSWVCYYDSNGYFRFEPPSNIFTKGSTWDFSTSEITYISSNHRYEFSKVFNSIVVIGDNINGATFRGTASDTNVDSPTRIALIGKKTKVIEDNLIYSTELATIRAEAELQASISLVETTDISALAIDIISGGDIVTVTDVDSGMDGTRFLVKSGTFPITIDSDMSLQCWKGRSLD